MGGASAQASGQTGFDFGGPPALNLDRTHIDALYFAVLPDDETSRALAAAGRGLLTRWRRPATSSVRLHVSVWGVSRSKGLDAEVVAAARAVGDQVAWPDFEVVFTKAATFGGGALVFLCADGAGWALRGLHDALSAASEDLGFGPRPRRPFEPHLTFARSAARMEEVVLDEPIRWPARELVLVHSEQGRGRHAHLARWPLLGAGSLQGQALAPER